MMNDNVDNKLPVCDLCKDSAKELVDSCASSGGCCGDSTGKAKRKSKFSLKRALWMLIRTYLLFLVVLYFVQDYLIFHPSSDIIATPETIGLQYDDVWLVPDSLKPDEKVNAWYVPSKQDKGTVLFCHGNARNISYRLDMLGVINRLGYNCLMLDYRGFGLSGGKPSEKNMYEDVWSAWYYLANERKIPADSILIHGRSLGGGAASWLAKSVTPAGLVLESTFTSGINLAQSKIPVVPVKYFAKFRFDTIGRINQIKCPILFVHSKDDTLIPVSHSEKLYNAFNGGKYRQVINGTHNYGFMTSGNLYSDAIAGFYQRAVDGGSKAVVVDDGQNGQRNNGQ